MTTLLTSGTTVACQAQYRHVKVLFSNGRHRLESTTQLRSEKDVGLIRRRILALMIYGVYRVTINETEEIKLSKPSNKVTDIVRSDSTFLFGMKTLLELVTVFKKEYIYKFLLAHIVVFEKEMMDNDFMTEMSAQSSYRYIWVAEMMVRYENVHSPVKGLNADDAE